jgi:hypothetical protein
LGTETVGLQTDAISGNTVMVAKRIVPPVSGLLVGVEAYAKGNSSNVQCMSALLYDDSNGAPGKTIAWATHSSTSATYNGLLTTTPRWVNASMTQWLEAGVPVWLVLICANNLTLYYDNTPNTDYRVQVATTATWSNDTAAFAVQARTYSIRGVFVR